MLACQSIKLWIISNINKSINNLPNIKNKTQLNIIQNNILPIDFLRKYIYYAKAYINPQLTNESREFISKSYMVLRKYSIKEQGLINPITVRTLNSLIKISTAFAKCRLSQKIEREELEDALELLCDSIFSIGEYEDEGDSDIEEIEEEYQEIKNKSIINKKEKKEKNEDNIKEKIIPLKEEEDEVIEQNKNKKNKLNIKEKKEKEKEKIIKKNEMNNVIDNTQTEIDKEQTILKYIHNYAKSFGKKIINVEELWNNFKETKECLISKILNKKELFNIIAKLEDKGKIQTSINII